MYSTNLFVSGEPDTSFWLNITDLVLCRFAFVEDCGKKMNGILQLQSYSKKGERNIENFAFRC